MFTVRGPAGLAVVLAAALCGAPGIAWSQAAHRDAIAEMLARQPAKDGATPTGKPSPAFEKAAPPADPRAGDANYEQARRLMGAIDSILQDTARNRGEAKKLPSRDEFLVPPIWTETREDREAKIKNLLDSTLAVVTEVPVVEVQKRIETLKNNIRDLDERVVKLREKKLVAPKDGFMPGYVTDTVESLQKDIEDAQQRITANKSQIDKAKSTRHWRSRASR
jgi:polyhydroxyalkanoate synthesis regulator phasin